MGQSVIDAAIIHICKFDFDAESEWEQLCKAKLFSAVHELSDIAEEFVLCRYLVVALHMVHHLGVEVCVEAIEVYAVRGGRPPKVEVRLPLPVGPINTVFLHGRLVPDFATGFSKNAAH